MHKLFLTFLSNSSPEVNAIGLIDSRIQIPATNTLKLQKPISFIFLKAIDRMEFEQFEASLLMVDAQLVPVV